MNADFLRPGDPRWGAFLEDVPHDFYHLPRYAELSARYEGGEPLAFYAQDGPRQMLAPLLKRRLPAGLQAPFDGCDAATPYGYPCPLLTPACDAGSVRQFLRAFVELGRHEKIVTAFFRLHPLFPLPADALGAAGQVVLHGPTVYVDLTLSREEIWRQTRSRYRTDINKLHRLGFHAVMDDWSLLDDFVAIYRDTMHRLGADRFYFFDDEYFRRCRQLARDGMHLCSVLAPSGEVAAAGLFTAVGRIVQYHLSGTAEPYCQAAPNKLMLDAVRWWAKDQGYALFHLGGGLGAVSPTLFHFKSGFSRLQADFHTWRVVLDAAKHELLVDLWRKRNPGDEPAAGFFPQYRCAPGDRETAPAHQPLSLDRQPKAA